MEFSTDKLHRFGFNMVAESCLYHLDLDTVDVDRGLVCTNPLNYTNSGRISICFFSITCTISWNIRHTAPIYFQCRSHLVHLRHPFLNHPCYHALENSRKKLRDVENQLCILLIKMILQCMKNYIFSKYFFKCMYLKHLANISKYDNHTENAE